MGLFDSIFGKEKVSASSLSNIATHSSKVLSILKVKTEVKEQDIKKRSY